MIAAVIVSYNPECESFTALLKSLASQVDKLFIIDNSDRDNDSAWQFACGSGIDLDHVNLFRLGDNLGIATALNIGIEAALNEGARWVLLSDQDSLPGPNMVSGLTGAASLVEKDGRNFGAIGPTYTDLHTKLTYPFQVQEPGRFFYSHRYASDAAPIVEALTLITSGCLIPAHVFRDVGLMREDFFIDHVDIEWCHRARSKGYHIYGTARASMYQRMGEDMLRVWYLRWRNESAYSPLRVYYRIRNFIALWKMDFIDWRWKLRSTWYWLGFVYVQIVFGRQRTACFGMFLKGVWHGAIGRMGRYS